LLGNIVDHRTDPYCPEVDAAFEPSVHDNARRPNGSEHFEWDQATADPAYFYVTATEDTTVREAVLRAERDWSFPVTLYLYDRGTRPLG
jgi:hypothetical protein